ncbi:thiamine diphosphokinase [Chloroflexota bacterium]
MKALILINGELYKPDILRRRIITEVFDLVIGVDGGARYSDTLNVTLDAVIGDLDSLSNLEQQSMNSSKVISYPEEKDEIDLELALLYAREQGADQIVMVGVMGGRMDMTIANIMLMTHTGLSSCSIEIWHGQETGWGVKPPGKNITGDPGDTISLIPLGGDVSSIITRGLKYPLKGEKLSFGQVRGVSNVMDKTYAYIEFSKGFLLVTHSPLSRE